MSGITSEVLMIRPKHFGYNEETALNNTFQTRDDRDKISIQKEAIAEFDQLVELLEINHINVNIIEDTDEPVKPDAIFPNNWISFHKYNIVITYPMNAPSRRTERREEIIKALEGLYEMDRRYHFEQYEEQSQYLEGTGSMVLDRINKVCYACLSPRTDIILLDKFCLLMGYKQISFTAVDASGIQIYHTNVMMAMGDGYMVVCLDAIADEDEKIEFIKSAQQNNVEIIEIKYAQMNSFAGNMLQLKNRSGELYMVMSSEAYRSLSAYQIKLIEKRTKIIHSSIPTIERYGGGSVRCMIAEIFLNKSL